MENEEKTLDDISASTTRYYDSLTDEERAEDLAWGEFALAQLVRDEGADDCPAPDPLD
jgi:hypothetical protein